MAMKTTTFLTFIFLTAGLISCNEDEPKGEFTESISPIVATELPDNGDVNEKIIFTISHGVYNGCGHYSRHETVIIGKEVYVTFFAKYPVDAACTYNAPVLSTSYEFTPTLTGEYTFHFSQAGGDYLLDNLLAN